MRVLSPKRAAIFQYLHDRLNQEVSREKMLKDLWKNTYVMLRTIDVHVHEIRKVMVEYHIEQIRYYGYRMTLKDGVKTCPHCGGKGIIYEAESTQKD